MTHKEAYEIIQQIFSQLRLLPAEHQRLQDALAVLCGAKKEDSPS